MGEMTRADQLARLKRTPCFDVVVIGGGATGLGTAVEAVSRGLSVALFESRDFCQGTSSRSTKLIHGGVRYLAQGNLTLVRDALRERGILVRQAAHLVRTLPLVLPLYRWWEGPFYWTGLKAYDLLAGKLGLGPTRWLSETEVRRELPALAGNGLWGGIRFFDAQFDDARLGITLAGTAVRLGAVILNYISVVGLLRAGGRVAGVAVRDATTGDSFEVPARVVINAAGTGADAIRAMADPAAHPRITLSRGSHVVLPASCLGGASALLVPHTDDRRVLFAVPWLGRVVAGTTDVPVEREEPEPAPTAEEIDFILAHLGRYLRERPTHDQVLSVFAGLRPLVGEGAGRPGRTSALSRDHVLEVLGGGLVSVMGGKWTTYRKMAEDAVDRAAQVGGLAAGPSRSAAMALGPSAPEKAGVLAVYGGETEQVEKLLVERPELGEPLHPRLPYLKVQVVWAARREAALKVEDALARRTRSLLLDAAAAMEAAPAAAELMAQELGWDRQRVEQEVADFRSLATRYLGKKC
ncbi:MAG: glycerol-3-phosphate dehydrogenase/oxidase [Acidobacteriota bacterium]